MEVKSSLPGERYPTVEIGLSILIFIKIITLSVAIDATAISHGDALGQHLSLRRSIVIDGIIQEYVTDVMRLIKSDANRI
jgi:hypothetical protein